MDIYEIESLKLCSSLSSTSQGSNSNFNSSLIILVPHAGLSSMLIIDTKSSEFQELLLAENSLKSLTAASSGLISCN